MYCRFAGRVAIRSVRIERPFVASTVEAFGRSAENPVGGWYGLRNGYRGRFGMYLPPPLERLGRAGLAHGARHNKIRAIPTDPRHPDGSIGRRRFSRAPSAQ